MTKEEIHKKISEYCDINYHSISKSDIARIYKDNLSNLDDLLLIDGKYYNKTITSCKLKSIEKKCEDCGKCYNSQRIITKNLKTKHHRCNICKTE